VNLANPRSIFKEEALMTEHTPQAHNSMIEYLTDGYDVPFGTFTWAQWQVMQAETMQRFTRFQRAIERKEAHDAMKIALEMQEMTLLWLKEACAWVDEM
jgi:hypothetical protein